MKITDDQLREAEDRLFRRLDEPEKARCGTCQYYMMHLSPAHDADGRCTWYMRDVPDARESVSCGQWRRKYAEDM